MSAIGSYVLISRTKFAECLELVRNVHSETTGKWVLKKTRVVGMEEFKEAWSKAVITEVDFDCSGYVLGNYLDAQKVVNNIELVDEQSEVMTVLAKVFTAGFLFEQSISLPDLPSQQLLEFCREEYADEAAGMLEALNGAHAFFERGLGEITAENLVVFLIQ
jgi:hypothetical protein